MEKQILILLAAYKGGRFIRPMVDSILAQDVGGWKRILSDDGEDTTPILQEYADRYPDRITHYRSGRRFGSAQKHFMHLLEQFGDDISVLPHDNYYAAHHDLSLEQRQTLNYDHPASFDTDRMIQDLPALRAGKTIHCPVYDYAIHDRTEETRELKPTKVILVEGILIFENKTLRDLMDIKIFVDTDADVRILRRIVRDVKERGRSLDSVVEQYLATVKPMHEQFVEPSKRYADLIVPEGGKNSVALMMIIQRIAYHIEHGDVVAEQ